MAHKHGYLTLRNKNAKHFMEMVGKDVTIILKGTVVEASMEEDIEGSSHVGFMGSEGRDVEKTIPMVEIDVKTAVPKSKKSPSDMSNAEMEKEIRSAKEG